MQVAWLFPLLLVSVAWATEDGCTMSKTTQSRPCANVKVIQRVPSSASGRWYLIASKKQAMMDKTNNQVKMPNCAGFISAAQTSCSSFDISSSLPEPYIPEYNVTSFSFNMTTCKYDYKFLEMKLIDGKSSLAIFNVGPKGGAKNVIRGLATDDHKSFMLLYVCTQSGEEEDLWFLSKTPVASDAAVSEANKVLESNNMMMSQLSSVSQEDCVYPPMPGAMTPHDMIKLF